MRYKILPLVLCVILTLCTSCGKKPKETAETPEPGPEASAEPAEMTEPIVGIWFSYLEYQSLCQGMNEEQFSAFCDQAVENMKSIGINRMYLHAVAFTDAFYDSKIYPATNVLPGIDYDPFLIFSKKARNAGIKVEAWINPMRSVTVEEMAELPEDFIIRKWVSENNERVRQSGTRYYLNPAYPEVRELIVSVVKELMEKYELDGIHMDDYFYPYGTEKNFDAYIYSLAQEENPELTLEEFRTSNTDQMVREIHDAVKAKDPTLLFDISPAGNIENCLTLLFANPYHWAEEHLVDYISPQIYWGYLHPVKPFEPTVEEWLNVVEGTGVALVPGLAAYRIGTAENVSSSEEANKEFQDNDDMMVRQIQTALEKGCKGIVFFSYQSFFAPEADAAENVEKEIIHIKTLAGLN